MAAPYAQKSVTRRHEPAAAHVARRRKAAAGPHATRRKTNGAAGGRPTTPKTRRYIQDEPPTAHVSPMLKRPSAMPSGQLRSQTRP